MKVLSSLSSVYSLKENKNDFRNDPYFYNEKFVTIYNFIKTKSSYKIGDFFDIFTGISPTGNYSKEGIPFIRIQDLELFGVFEENVVRVKEKNINKVPAGVQKYDILLAITGATIGKVSIYLGEEHAFCTSDILILRAKQKVSIEEIFGIYTLFLSQHYFLIFKKGVTGVSNQHLNPKYVYKIPVILNEKFKKIGNKLKQAIEAKIEAEKKRKEIDKIFRKYFDIDLKPHKEMSSIYNLQKAKEVKRVDPKHFSAKLVIYENILFESKLDLILLKKIVKKKIRRGVQPQYDKDGEIPVIKTGNVYDSPIRWETTSKVNIEFYKKNKEAHVPKNSLIVTSTGEGSWGRTSISTLDQAIADGHIAIIEINEKMIEPYYVCAFLWTPYGKTQYERRVRGSTGQTEIYPMDIETVIIPRLDKKDENKISEGMRIYFTNFYNSIEIHSQAMEELNKLLSLTPGGNKS